MSDQTRRPNRRRRRRHFNYRAIIFWLAVVLVVLGIIAVVTSLAGNNGSESDTKQSSQHSIRTEATSGTTVSSHTTSTTTKGSTAPMEPTPPDEPQETVKESTATIGATGDVLMHLPCIRPAKTSNGYDFTPYFTHIQDYLTAPDYMVANLETTLAALDNGYEYHGYPNFNCPDEIVYDLQAMGVDMFLTANNHTYDTSTVGFNRTQQIIAEAGLDHIGTKISTDVDDYLVKDINGIKIGMVCYTYETDAGKDSVRLNDGAKLPSGVASRINTFHGDDVAGFIKNLGQDIEDMKADGAEAVVLYIHWGVEYQLKQNKIQEKFAQAACDLGVDVIVGGHPHVIQPMDLLTSNKDEDHKTVCLYSTGNFMSNQRLGNISYVHTAHTEDGILFNFSFARYSDGTVRLEEVELLPLWIDMHTRTGKTIYDVIPLDKEVEDWKTQFGLTDKTLKQAEDSYQRTMKIVGDGLEEVQKYLDSLPPVE